MRRIFFATLLLCSLLSAPAFADSMRIYLRPNDGSGGNFGFVAYGVGYSAYGYGGTSPYFFTSMPGFGYARGATVGGSTEIFFSGGYLQIGPNYSDVAFTGVLFVNSITMPMNGRSFRAPSVVGIDVSAVLPSTGETFNIGGSASGYILFYYSSYDGLYYPDRFVQVPEPGALILIGTGFVGIFARAGRKALARV